MSRWWWCSGPVPQFRSGPSTSAGGTCDGSWRRGAPCYGTGHHRTIIERVLSWRGAGGQLTRAGLHGRGLPVLERLRADGEAQRLQGLAVRGGLPATVPRPCRARASSLHAHCSPNCPALFTPHPRLAYSPRPPPRPQPLNRRAPARHPVSPQGDGLDPRRQLHDWLPAERLGLCRAHRQRGLGRHQLQVCPCSVGGPYPSVRSPGLRRWQPAPCGGAAFPGPSASLARASCCIAVNGAACTAPSRRFPPSDCRRSPRRARPRSPTPHLRPHPHTPKGYCEHIRVSCCRLPCHARSLSPTLRLRVRARTQAKHLRVSWRASTPQTRPRREHGELRPAGPARSAQVGQREHRQLRGGPRQR